MSYAIVYRTAWKEYRTLRGFWFALLVIGLLFQWVLLVAAGATPQLAAVALVVTSLYALGCGATAFAVEREEGTIDLLRQLPTRGGEIVWGKVAFALGSTAALLAMLLLPGGLFLLTRDVQGELIGVTDEGISGLMMVLEAFTWGTFFSLIVRRPVVAAVLGVTGAIVAMALVRSLTAIAVYPDRLTGGPEVLIPGRLATVLVVVLGCLALVPGWYRGRRRLMHNAAADSGALAVISPGRMRTSVPSPWWALVWQQVRQTWSIWLAVPLLIAVAVVAISVDVVGSLVGVAALAAIIIGGTTFQTDQEDQHVRFLAERPVQPWLVWWSRQGASVSSAVVLLTIFAVVGLLVNDRARNPWPEFEGVAAGLLALAIAYTCGQWWSLAVRSSLMAVGLAFATALLLYGWLMLMFVGAVPWWWSVAPLPLALLISTRLRTAGWMLERNSPRDWLLPALPLVLLVTLVPSAAAAYRVLSIPLVDPGFDVAAYRRPPSEEERATAALYSLAVESLYWQRFPSPRRQYDVEIPLDDESHAFRANEYRPLWPALDQRQVDWLNANQQSLRFALEAAARDQGMVDVPIGVFFRLVNLLCLDAQRLQEQRQLDDAWQRLGAALRMMHHARHRALPPLLSGWGTLQSEIDDAIVGWAAAEGQSTERIKAAMEDYRAAIDRMPPVEDAFKYDYALFERFSEGDPAAMETLAVHRGEVRAFSVLRIMLFWEVARSRRAARIFTAAHSKEAEAVRDVLEGREPYPGGGLVYVKFESETERLSNPTLSPEAQSLWLDFLATPWVFSSFDRLVDGVEAKRATLIRMALTAWKHEHGTLPDSLDVLTEDYLEPLPTNPWTGGPVIYLPEGLPVPCRIDGGAVPEGTPLLWMPTRPGKEDTPTLASKPWRRHLLRAYPIP